MSLLKLINAVNKTAEMNCKIMNESQQKINVNENNCQKPFDDLQVTFEDKSGNQFYFYHLLEVLSLSVVFI